MQEICPCGDDCEACKNDDCGLPYCLCECDREEREVYDDEEEEDYF